MNQVVQYQHTYYKHFYRLRSQYNVNSFQFKKKVFRITTCKVLIRSWWPAKFAIYLPKKYKRQLFCQLFITVNPSDTFVKIFHRVSNAKFLHFVSSIWTGFWMIFTSFSLTFTLESKSPAPDKAGFRTMCKPTSPAGGWEKIAGAPTPHRLETKPYA